MCETAPDNSQCTIDAAVQEGNALGRADIQVPQSVSLNTPLVVTETTITGQLNLTSIYNHSLMDTDVRAAELHVAAGARLSLEQIDILVSGATSIDGAHTIHRGVFVGWIDVRAGGLLSMVNAQGGVWASALPPPTTNAWITNRGTVVLRFSNFNRFDSGPGSSMGAAFVHTLDGGTTSLGATVFEQGALTSPDCLGSPPVSEGYNLTSAGGLSSPGDIDDGIYSSSKATVPPGVAGCGTTVTVDFGGDPRRRLDAWPAGHCWRGVYE